ncbi:unnamed protein product [Rotaria magnacalcarata]|uniref:Cadherin domain-containing protein n=7 Tax=Rotaria magnacalcarata TaxID=392030 RepID=A0A815WST5_9BILA|nr:unnamed protein product [Rotaria magnacalcarata]CAF1548110.1 unnamed protein product [Rotaria magnacalcarata]CAF3974959.1 unnamed protein product [Rotaria magnacalcarata]
MSTIFFLLFFIKPIHTAIQRLPSISLNEQSSIGTSIYDLTRVYPSSSKNLIKFSFLYDSSPHNSFFIVDSLTGRISIKRMIDREELCQTHTCNCERCLLTLEIIASASTKIDILSLDIIIENINDNQPLFPTSTFQIRLSENTDLGYVASFPAATDLDFQDRLEYRIVPLDISYKQETLETFSIINLQTENQLGLRLLKYLDRERRNLYKMKILASDGQHIGALSLDIFILDSNDNVPKFEHEQYEIKLREDTPIGTEIIHVHAYDNDEGLNALINYTIMTDNPSSSFPFRINVTTGIIELVQLLDYEYEMNYRFSVRACDNGPDAVCVYSQVEIDILDVNDCPPEIDFILPDNHSQKNIFYINEEQEIHTRLFHLSVSDKDSVNNKIILKLLTHQNLFQLNEQYNDLYNLILIGRLDREQQEEYNLIFEAKDQGAEQTLTTEKHLTIRLIDINDCSPILDAYPTPININENNPSNIQLIQFHARDCDVVNTSNSLISYSLVVSNDSRFFHMDSKTGILSVKNISFDYELKDVYHLILNISDHGINPKRLETLQTLTIHINNLNDNKPKFEKEFYSFKLFESVPIGTFVGQVKAIDLDLNSIINYELTSIDGQNAFYVDFSTGELRTKILLDYEIHSIHRCYITAKDNDDLHSDRVLVTIQLIDVNDNAPIIDTPSSVYIASKLLESNASTTIVITNIIAHDHDSGKNGNLTYKIIDGNENGYFQLNLYNGTIISDINNLPQGYHRLTIKVCDQGDRIEKCSTVIINIKIGEYAEKLYYSDEIVETKQLIGDENILTNEMIFIIIIVSSIFTLLISITMGIVCAVFCKQKRYHISHRSSLKAQCELLQSTDADKLLATNDTNTFSSTSKNLNEHHHIEPYDDIKASGSAVSSEDSCYGSNDLSRSSSSGHGVTRPLLTPQHRSSSLSSTSVDYAIPVPRQHSIYDNKLENVDIQQSITNTSVSFSQQAHHLTTFHSPTSSSSNNSNLKKTLQSFTRRPIINLQSTYLTYDSIDTPPSLPNQSSISSSSTASTTSREYSI